ncbi:MAG: hypothetical protein GXX78_02405 [Bacteroidales bacterium]|nr:hypothetical protein [Bacteroidales bacterium]
MTSIIVFKLHYGEFLFTLNHYNNQESRLGHYFRTLYNIIKYIDTTNGIDRQFYVNIVRSQLCVDELIILFYNCLSCFGNEKFKPLVEKYGILEGLSDVYLLKPSHKALYNNTAFQENEVQCALG